MRIEVIKSKVASFLALCVIGIHTFKEEVLRSGGESRLIMRLPSDMQPRVQKSVKEELNDEDLQVIERFVVALQDPGIQLALEYAALDEYEGRSEALAVVREANRQVTNACRTNSGIMATDFDPKAIVRVAPAFVGLVNYASRADLFPEDFLPSKDVQQYCVNAFFESLRSRVAPPASSGVEHPTS